MLRVTRVFRVPPYYRGYLFDLVMRQVPLW